MVAPKRRSLSLPIVLSVVSVGLSIAMLVGWIVVLVQSTSKDSVFEHVWLLVTGILSLTTIASVLVLFTVFLVREIREVRRQTSFIDSVTHELKSPLAALKLCAETMARPELESDRREELRVMMLEDVQRLVTVIDGILEASRVGQGRNPRTLGEIDLAHLVEDAVATIARRHKLVADRVKLTLPEDLTFVVDPAALRTVVENLVDNAIKYSRDTPEIEVLARREGDELVFEVRDQGIGIARHDIKRIFQRFYRVPEEAVRSRHGTGLGLYVVQGLLRAMGGRIEAISEGAGRGTTMRVRMPLRPR